MLLFLSVPPDANEIADRSKLVVVKIEELPGQVYLWDKDSEEFLAQGKDFDEAIDKCINRFPGTKFKVLRLVADETSN